MSNIVEDSSTVMESDIDSNAPADSEQLARQQAIRQIEARRRRFKISAAASALGVTLLVPIWAGTEYRNAGGWPTRGFSQSSGVHKVWNIWIIYPVISWVVLTAAHGWLVYGRKPIPESEIQREIERRTSPPR